MFKFNLFLLSAFCLSTIYHVQAQSVLNDCGNLGFETGGFSGWQGQYGVWAPDPAGDSIILLSREYGFDPNRFRIRRIEDGFLPEITDELIPYVSDGSSYTLQLGNSKNGAQYERLVTTFLVDSTNSLFQYRFAVIFEDPGHVEIEQPKFVIEVFDDKGNLIPCGYYKVTAGEDLDGFKKQGKLRYRNWTTAGMDLRAYIGQKVTLRVSTFDCSQGGHWGMALFDASCFEAKIEPVNFCPGKDQTAVLAAPDGFQNYQWSTGETTRVISVTVPLVKTDYTVTFSPYSSLDEDCRLSLSFSLPQKEVLFQSKEAVFCQNKPIQIASSYQGLQFFYKWSPGGETTPYINVTQPGTYILEITKDNCVLSDTMVISMNISPQLGLDALDPSCDGKADGALTCLSFSTEPLRYQWSTGQTTGELTGLASGEYSLTVTGEETGCTTVITKQLVQSDSVFVEAEVTALPLCIQSPEGKAAAVGTKGVPPYTFVWSTGRTGETTPLKTHGVFTVTITDSKGCRNVDSVLVVPLFAGLETEGNVCEEGRDGSIDITPLAGYPPFTYSMDLGTFQPNPSFKGLANGYYEVFVKDNRGCVRSFETEIKSIRKNPFEAWLPADTTIKIGDELTVRADFNYPLRAITWDAPDKVGQDDSMSVRILPINMSRIKVYGVDTFGCKAETQMLVRVAKDYRMYIPNVFKPRGDEGDSEFYFSSTPNLIKDVVSCRIFDRWGNMVYEDDDFMPNNPTGGWNGEVGGSECPPGVYAYRLEVEFIDGVIQVFHGDVTLVR